MFGEGVVHQIRLWKVNLSYFVGGVGKWTDKQSACHGTFGDSVELLMIREK